MNFKKVISIFASLALTVSCLAGFAMNANAEEETVTLPSTKSASAMNSGSVLVLNPNGTEGNPITWNANTSTYKGVAVLEFQLPAVDPNRIIGAELKISLYNQGNRNGNRTYDVCKSKGVTITSDTALADILAANGDKLLTGEALKDGAYRNDTLTDDAIKNYIKEQASADTSNSIQFAFTNSAQALQIYTKEDNTVTQIEVAVPTLTLTLADASAKTTTYKTKYIDSEGNEIKTAVTKDGIVGTEYSISEDDKVDFMTADKSKKYIYVGGGIEKLTAIETADSNVLTVVFREAAKYEMKVIPSTDETNILKEASVFEGDDYSYSYSKYLTDVNKKVIASTNDTTYVATVKPTESTTITIPYTAYEGNAWFVEGEEITDTNAVSDNRLSGGIARRNLGTAKEIFTISEDGVYDITFVGCTNRVAEDYTCDMSVYKGSTEAENLIKTVDLTGASVNKIKTEKIATGITLKAGDKILVKGNDSNPAVDYILFEKTGNIAPEIITGTVTENAPEISTDTTVTAVTANAPVFDKTALGVNVIKTISVKVDNAEENVIPVLYVNDTAAQTTWTADATGVYYAQFAVPSVGDFADFGTVKVVYGSGEGAIEKTINITE